MSAVAGAVAGTVAGAGAGADAVAGAGCECSDPYVYWAVDQTTPPYQGKRQTGVAGPEDTLPAHYAMHLPDPGNTNARPHWGLPRPTQGLLTIPTAPGGNYQSWPERAPSRLLRKVQQQRGSKGHLRTSLPAVGPMSPRPCWGTATGWTTSCLAPPGGLAGDRFLFGLRKIPSSWRTRTQHREGEATSDDTTVQTRWM